MAGWSVILVVVVKSTRYIDKNNGKRSHDGRRMERRLQQAACEGEADEAAHEPQSDEAMAST